MQIVCYLQVSDDYGSVVSGRLDMSIEIASERNILHSKPLQIRVVNRKRERRTV